MFSEKGLSLEPGTTSRGRGAGPWPWPVHTRLLLALLTLFSGLALRLTAHSTGCEGRTSFRVVPVLVIDPNTAPASVLEALPHMGPSLVQRLIEQREIRRFESTEDLRRRVRGVGPATLARLAPHLRIRTDGERPIDVTTVRIDSAPVPSRLARGPSSLISSR